MAELERRLVAKGCDKVNLLIEPTNAGVQGFYEMLGYRKDDTSAGLRSVAEFLMPHVIVLPSPNSYTGGCADVGTSSTWFRSVMRQGFRLPGGRLLE